MALASDVVAAARRTLQDYDADRVSDEELLRYANGARRALAIARPSVYDTLADLTLAQGAMQSCPADCANFYGLPYNIEFDGERGKAITVAEVELLDALEPNWRQGMWGDTVHYCYDERTPNRFEVYPPAEAGAKVAVSYSRIPVDLALSGSLIALEGLLIDALVDYTIARALLDDAESPVNQQRAMLHMQAFASVTGANLRMLITNSPNSANLGGRFPKAQGGQ